MEEPWFVSVCVVGLLSNAVLLTILFKYEKGWSLGKTMLVFLHVTEVALLFCQLPPYIAVIHSAPTVPGLEPVIYLPGYTWECAPSAIVLAFAIVLEPYILAMLAYIRWSVVRSSVDLNKTGKEPPVRKMIAILLAAVLLNTIIGEVTNAGEYTWSPLNICLKDGGQRYYRDITLVLSFVICAPFIGYCYYNVIRTLRDTKGLGGGGNQQKNKKRTEAIRLLVVLTGYYYVSHSAFFVSFSALSFAETDIAGLTGTRVFSIVYLTYAMMSPIFSILLTERYRMYAMRMFRLVPPGSTLSGSGNKRSSGGSQSGSGVNKTPARATKTIGSMTKSSFVPSVLRAPAASTASTSSSQGGSVPAHKRAHDAAGFAYAAAVPAGGGTQHRIAPSGFVQPVHTTVLHPEGQATGFVNGGNSPRSASSSASASVRPSPTTPRASHRSFSQASSPSVRRFATTPRASPRSTSQASPPTSPSAMTPRAASHRRASRASAPVHPFAMTPRAASHRSASQSSPVRPPTARPASPRRSLQALPLRSGTTQPPASRPTPPPARVSTGRPPIPVTFRPLPSLPRRPLSSSQVV